MYFPSKKDLFYTVIAWGTMLVMIVPIVVGQNWSELWFALPIVAFLGWLWFGTGYAIEEGTLLIRFGPFRSRISIQDIRKLRKTKNPLSSAALSLDRIEVSHGKFHDATYLSPVNERQFIRLLLEQNPSIELSESLRKQLEIE